MHEPVTRPEKVHECAEVDHFDNFPGIDHTDFRFGDDPANPLDRGSRRITIHRREAGGAWLMRVAIAGGRISVETLGAELIVDAIYRNSSIAR